jgi:deferrochelatase/peroxidase EfeB
MSNVQRALLASPGRFDAVCLYGRTDLSVTPADIRRSAAQLIAFFDKPSGFDFLYVLVAVSEKTVEGKLPARPSAAAAITSIGDGRFRLGDASVFVQISAQSDVHRLYAMRVVAEILGPVLGSCQEIVGARLLNGQETFGFPDAQPGTGNYAKAAATALPQEGSWLFFQRFRQNAQKFFRRNETPLARGLVLGIAPTGPAALRAAVAQELTGSAPKNSHVPLMKAAKAPLIRRGFPCRYNGEEGLAFIGVTGTLETIPMLLKLMNDTPDSLLQYVESKDGGLFYCPPNAEWLTEEHPPPFEPVTTAPLSHSGHLISYDTTTAFYRYMLLLKAHGLFDIAERPTAISDGARAPMDALYGALARGDKALSDQMKVAEQEALKQAASVNAGYDVYITFG